MDLSSELADLNAAIAFTELEEVRRNPLKFAEYIMRDERGVPWKLGQHHKEWYRLVCGLCSDLLYGKIDNDFILQDRFPNLLLMGPREHGKTQTLVCFVLFLFGHCPDIRIKYVTESDKLATDIVGQVKKNIEKNERLREVFPDLRPRTNGAWTGHKLEIDVPGGGLGNKDASLEAYGITSSATGGRADVIIFDDIIGSRAAAAEPTTLEKVERIFRTDWLNIGSSHNIVVGTPWTPTDLHQQLLDDTAWVHWKKPAESVINGIRTSLWPERWPLEALDAKLATIKEVAYNQQYLLKGLQDRQDWWTKEIIECALDRTIKLGEVPFEIKDTYCGLDPAASLKKSGSFSCITAIAVGHEGQKAILEIDRFRARPRTVAEKIIAMNEKYGFRKILVENNATQSAFIDLIAVLAEKYATTKVTLRGNFTGSQKWNPEIGLPGLVAEMSKGIWHFPYKGDHSDPLYKCPICNLIEEMLGYPYETDTTDMIMSLWLADTAIRNGGFDANMPVIGGRAVHKGGW